MTAKELIEILSRFDEEDALIFEVRMEDNLPQVFTTTGTKVYTKVYIHTAKSDKDKR